MISASASVESMTGRYSNAFSLVVPGIIDSGWLVRDQRTDGSRSRHLLEWGLTTGGMPFFINRPILVILKRFP